jgi:hypothetical protein
MASTKTRRRGGPWPGWLRWWNEQGGPARDARAWWLFYSNFPYVTQADVAAMLGCSQSTVSRALKRHPQRLRGEWPPEVSNGFGLSQEQRRALRMRQLGYEEPLTRLTPTENAYVPPADQFDDNGDPAW